MSQNNLNDFRKDGLDKIVNDVNVKMSNLFRMKDNNKLTLGQFVDCEFVNFNNLKEKLKNYPLVYTSDFNGDLNGKIILNIDTPLSINIARILMGDEINEVDEIVHASMNELLNIFSGNLITYFMEENIDIDIDVPVLKDYDFINSEAKKKIIFRYICNGEMIQFVMEVN